MRVKPNVKDNPMKKREGGPAGVSVFPLAFRPGGAAAAEEEAAEGR